MARPYPQELRQAIVHSIANGSTREQVAKDYEVSLSTVQRLLHRWRLSGNVRPDKFGGYKPYALKPHEKLIRQAVIDRPDITVKQMRAYLLKQGISASKSAIARFLNHLYPEAAEPDKHKGRST